MYQGIDGDWTQKEIQRRLEEATGEKISNGSLSRFVVHYRTKRDQERAAQVQANRLIAAVKEGNVDAVEAARAFLNQTMVELIDAGEAGMDAETALRLNRQYAEFRLKEKKIDLEHDQLDLAKLQVKSWSGG